MISQELSRKRLATYVIFGLTVVSGISLPVQAGERASAKTDIDKKVLMPAMAALEYHAVDFTQASLAFQNRGSGARARLESYPSFRMRVNAFRTRLRVLEK
jgi:hypothetical protein